MAADLSEERLAVHSPKRLPVPMNITIPDPLRQAALGRLHAVWGINDEGRIRNYIRSFLIIL